MRPLYSKDATKKSKKRRRGGKKGIQGIYRTHNRRKKNRIEK